MSTGRHPAVRASSNGWRPGLVFLYPSLLVGRPCNYFIPYGIKAQSRQQRLVGQGNLLGTIFVPLPALWMSWWDTGKRKCHSVKSDRYSGNDSEGSEFRVILSYIVNLRPAWTSCLILPPLKQKQKQKPRKLKSQACIAAGPVSCGFLFCSVLFLPIWPKLVIWKEGTLKERLPLTACGHVRCGCSSG